jgi:Thioredoxin
MNGCFHCNAMMPSWQAAKKNVQKLKGTVLVADVEYSNMYLLPRGMQGINGFPTIKAFTNKIIEYPGVNSGISGDRSTDSFVAFISKYMIKPKPNPKSKPKEKVA